MNNFTTLSNAPIVEAILDIKANLPDGLTLSIFEEFYENIKDRFKDRKTRHSVEAQFKFSPGMDESTTVIPKGKADGYLFQSSNENKIVQARLDGFTFNTERGDVGSKTTYENSSDT